MKGSFETGGFTEFLARVQGKSAATVDAYLRDVAAFNAYCDQQNCALADGLTKPRVGLYLVERIGSQRRVEGQSLQLTARSAARHVSALQALAQYLVYTGELAENPLAGFKAPKYSRELPPYFSSDEIRHIVCAFDGVAETKPLYLRNAAILHLLCAEKEKRGMR